MLLAFPTALWIAVQGRVTRVPAALRNVCLWLGVLGAAVAIPYIAFAWRIEIRSPTEFLRWVTDYLESQHGLQWALKGLPQSAIGVSRSLVQMHWIEQAWMKEPAFPTVWRLFSALAVAGCGAVALLWKADSSDRRFSAECYLEWGCAGAWTLFVFLWEPVTGYYWVLALLLLRPPARVCSPGADTGACGSRASVRFASITRRPILSKTGWKPHVFQILG